MTIRCEGCDASIERGPEAKGWYGCGRSRKFRSRSGKEPAIAHWCPACYKTVKPRWINPTRKEALLASAGVTE
jgi:hypothetical protein